MSEYRLFSEIIDRSAAKEWEQARAEWRLVNIYEDPDNTCLCGHHPITEICVLFNEVTGERAEVGNCCVKKFGSKQHLVVPGIQRIRESIGAALTFPAIEFCFDQGIMRREDTLFYLDTFRKRILTERQLWRRKKINEEVLRAIERHAHLR